MSFGAASHLTPRVEERARRRAVRERRRALAFEVLGHFPAPVPNVPFFSQNSGNKRRSDASHERRDTAPQARQQNGPRMSSDWTKYVLTAISTIGVIMAAHQQLVVPSLHGDMREIADTTFDRRIADLEKMRQEQVGEIRRTLDRLVSRMDRIDESLDRQLSLLSNQLQLLNRKLEDK